MTSVKPCDCEVAKEGQANFQSWSTNFRKEINEGLARLNA